MLEFAVQTEPEEDRVIARQPRTSLAHVALVGNALPRRCGLATYTSHVAEALRQRYPSMKVIAPAGARQKVEEVVPVDATTVDFGDPAVRFMAVPGTGDKEGALVVETANGTTIVLNDLIFDLANRPGLSGWLFKAIGMTGNAPHIPLPIMLKEVKDKQAVSAQLDAWADVPDLQRVIISHGDVIADRPGAVLKRISMELRA